MIFFRRTTFSTSILAVAATFSIIATSWSVVAQQRDLTREEYIERYKHIAIDHQQRYGIPASITMAQGILESNNGNSHLERGSNNHFGIKCKTNLSGAHIHPYR